MHADLVARELHKNGFDFFRFNTEAASEYEICLDIGGESHIKNTLTGRHLRLSGVKSVWLRRRSIPIISNVSEEFLSLVENEWKLFFQNLWTAMQDSFWISPPDAIDSARSKFEQLRRAQNIGLSVPETRFTNSLSSAQELRLKNSGGIIFKPHDMGALHPKSGKAVYTNLCDFGVLEDPKAKDSLRICPGIFQEYIPKTHDVRVNVVGERVFATEIRSTTEKLDWRRYNFTTLSHREISLPDEVRDGCIRLVKSFGLQFGAIDFAACEDGRLIFLEINANGQWAWIQAMTGQPISTAITDLLVTGKNHC